MAKEQPEKSSKFINAVDRDLHDSILRLDQKLKGFLAEINVKLEVVQTDSLGLKEERKNQLVLLSEEVKKAIEGIESIVNMVVEGNISETEFREMNREELEALREEFKNNIEKISKLREEL